MSGMISCCFTSDVQNEYALLKINWVFDHSNFILPPGTKYIAGI